LAPFAKSTVAATTFSESCERASGNELQVLMVDQKQRMVIRLKQGTSRHLERSAAGRIERRIHAARPGRINSAKAEVFQVALAL
jgi:hypothetical protein